jgi:hypothetical protein
LGRVENSRKDHASTHSNGVEGSLDSYAIAHVPFFRRSSKVEGSREGYATALLCFGAYIALSSVFFDFCSRFRRP